MQASAESHRIETLSDEVNRLREANHDRAGEITSVMLGLAEIKLNLAVQDKTLSVQADSLKMLTYTVVGNGKPGLATRVMQLENQAQASATRGRDWRKLGWLIVGALISHVASIMPHLWSGK